MCQRLNSYDRLLEHREVTHTVEETSTYKMLVAVHQAARRNTVKHIHTKAGDAYSVPGTVHISAFGNR